MSHCTTTRDPSPCAARGVRRSELVRQDVCCFPSLLPSAAPVVEWEPEQQPPTSSNRPTSSDVAVFPGSMRCAVGASSSRPADAAVAERHPT